MHNVIHHPVSACTCNTSGLTHAWQSKRGPGRCGHTGKYHQGRPPYLQPGFCECKMFHGFTGDSPVLSHLDGSNDVFILIFIGVLKARLNPFDSIWAKGKPSMYINVDTALAMVPLKANHSCPMSSHKTLKKQHVLQTSVVHIAHC